MLAIQFEFSIDFQYSVQPDYNGGMNPSHGTWPMKLQEMYDSSQFHCELLPFSHKRLKQKTYSYKLIKA